MKSRRRNRSAKRSRWAWNNSPAGLRNRRAKADARREERASLLPPVPDDPTPGALWQRIVVDVYIPTSGRCDQHDCVIDGERVGLLSATGLGRAVAGRISKRPSIALCATMRREEWIGV